MSGFLYTGDFSLKIPCGEQLSKLLYFGDIVDTSTTPPTVTNPQDWTGWTQLKAGFTTSTDQVQSPLFEATVTIEGAAVNGVLRLTLTSAQTISIEAGGFVHGRCDIFGRVDGAPKKVRAGVWYAVFASTENF